MQNAKSMYLLLFLDLDHSTKQQFQVLILVACQNFQNLERSTTKLKIYSAFGRYIMTTKEATYFNFHLPCFIKGTLKYSFSVSRCLSLFIDNDHLFKETILKNYLYVKKHWRTLSEEGKKVYWEWSLRKEEKLGGWKRNLLIRLMGWSH